MDALRPWKHSGGLDRCVGSPEGLDRCTGNHGSTVVVWIGEVENGRLSSGSGVNIDALRGRGEQGRVL